MSRGRDMFKISEKYEQNINIKLTSVYCWLVDENR